MPNREMNRASLFVNLALAIGAACSTIALLEVGARVVFPSTPQLAMYRAQTDMVYEIMPSFRGTGPRGEAVRINAAGLRGPELASKRDGSVRVLVVGDSFTFGLDVSEEESLPGALLRALDASERVPESEGPRPPQSATPPRIEMLNAGVPGYNLFQERRLIDRRAAELQADAIVLVLIENDLYNVDGGDFVARGDGSLAWRPGTFRTDVNVNPFAALSGPLLWLQLHSVAFREASFRAIRARLMIDGDRELEARARASETSSDLPSRLLRGEDDTDTRPRWSAAEAELRAATATANQLGVPLIEVLFPRPEQLYSERLRGGFARLTAMAAACGARVVDPSAIMARVPDRIGLYLFPDDHHPSPRGYDLVARVVAPVVSDSLAGATGGGGGR
jgi:lysophospholipase L1-like esterase